MLSGDSTDDDREKPFETWLSESMCIGGMTTKRSLSEAKPLKRGKVSRGRWGCPQRWGGESRFLTSLEVLRDLADETLEGKLADEELGRLLILPVIRRRKSRGRAHWTRQKRSESTQGAIREEKP